MWGGGGVQSVSTQAVSNDSSLGTPPNNEIWYTSTDGKVVTPYSKTGFGATILTNTYESGKGIITFDGDVTSIGYEDFYYRTGLTYVTIPNSVTSIGEWAFYDCTGLTSITIPNSVTSIGSNAFDGCSGLTKTNYTGDIASWYNIEFGTNANPIAYSRNFFINGTLLTDLVIPEGIETVNDAFSYCGSLTSVTIPNSVTNIGNYAFCDCTGLTSITIPNSVTSIGSFAFYDCTGLTSITIPNSVTNIGNYAFCDCTGLTSITIPNSVTSIEKYTFYSCSKLKSVTIPNSVTNIGNYAFDGCSGLTFITFNSKTPPTFGNVIFYNCSNLISIYIPKGSKSAYEAAENFSNYVGYLREPLSTGLKSFLDLYGLQEFWKKIKEKFSLTVSENSYLKIVQNSIKSIDINSEKILTGTTNTGVKLVTDGYIMKQIESNADEALTESEVDDLFKMQILIYYCRGARGGDTTPFYNATDLSVSNSTGLCIPNKTWRELFEGEDGDLKFPYSLGVNDVEGSAYDNVFYWNGWGNAVELLARDPKINGKAFIVKGSDYPSSDLLYLYDDAYMIN